MQTKTLSFESVGDNYKDFVVTKSIPIPELQCRLIELEHGPTGAQVMHIANDDEENVFCLSFRTLPETSNGVAHILEHTVLCGSEKFPVSDPFFSMIRRSLNTFMNAFTGADFTCYPAATQVKKDFYNLLEVYLDAVFHPNIKELSFRQEGHRLEFADGQDPSSPLEYKGIVFNEMKGGMSVPESRLHEAINQSLFPDLTYGINSGGDPAVIPELSYEKLLEFHRTYYHPSRCLFYFYGNLPLEGHLDFVEKQVLEGKERLPVIPPLKLQPRLKQPVKKKASYPLPADENPDEKTLVAFTWLTAPITEQKELLALSVLELILLNTDASPLKLALLRSGLCKQVSAYVDTEISEIPVMLALKGCRPENAEALEELIRKTLETVIEEGIPDEFVERAIHQLELHRSEIGGDSYPFGLTLFMRSGLIRQHGVPAEEGLKVHSLFEELRHDLKDPNYLVTLLKNHFLNNPHFVRVVMEPDLDLEAKEIAEERATLDEIRAKMSKEQAEELCKKAAQLEEFQKEQEKEDLSILPKVTLSDVPEQTRDYPLNVEQVGNLTVHHHDCFTNHLVYLDLVFDLPDIQESELSHFRLFLSLLSQVGAAGRSYKENLEFMEAHTGGVGGAVSLHTQASDPSQFNPSLQLDGKALARKADKLCTLMADTLCSADFSDVDRLNELLTKYWSALQSSLVGGAMRYASILAGSGLNVAGHINESWGGLQYYWAMEQILKDFQKDPAALIATFQDLQQRMLTLANQQLVISCDQETYKKLRDEGFYGLSELKTRNHQPWKGDFKLNSVPAQGRVIAAPVAFTAQTLKTVPYTHQDSAALAVAGYLFSNKTLHKRIREQGGAYGGGASARTLSGTFGFYGYRDPNLSSTLEAFKDAISGIMKGNFKDSDLEEAKLEVIQKLDSPVSPGGRAIASFDWLRNGLGVDVRQQYRDRLLGLTKSEVQRAVEQHLFSQQSKAAVVSFAGQELLEKERKLLLKQGLEAFAVKKIEER